MNLFAGSGLYILTDVICQVKGDLHEDQGPQKRA